MSKETECFVHAYVSTPEEAARAKRDFDAAPRAVPMKATHVVYRRTATFGKDLIKSRHASREVAERAVARLNAQAVGVDSPWRVADVTPAGPYELCESDFTGVFLRPRILAR